MSCVQLLEVGDVVVQSVVGCKPLFGWDFIALDEFLINGLASYSGVGLPNQVLCFHIGHVALITRNMLRFYIIRGPSSPVVAVFRCVTDWQLFCSFILNRGFRVERSLRKVV